MQEEGGEDGATGICAEEGGEDGATSICAEEGGEDGATRLCAQEDGVTSQGVEPEPPHAGEVSCTNGISPALEGESGTPRSGASVEDEGDQRPAAYRRRRRGRHGRDAQVAHTAWWSEDAWRQGSEPWWNPRGS